MHESFLVCWSSALLRTQAVRDAGGLRETEQPIADFPLFMRIALDWDFASVGSPLAAIRMHEDAATAREGYGRFTGEQYEVVTDLYRRLHSNGERSSPSSPHGSANDRADGMRHAPSAPISATKLECFASMDAAPAHAGCASGTGPPDQCLSA